jgi:alpha-mannosidase
MSGKGVQTMAQKLEKIYVVFKTHFDIGFTGLVSDVVKRYRTDMLKDVIDICEKTAPNAEHEKYVWTMSAWPLEQSLEGSMAEDREKALAFLENRQLIWHMLPYTTHTEFCGLEEWIRGIYVSRNLSEQFGYKPKDAKMTDVPGHTWSVPSLLAKAGVKILHLGCNPASTPPDVPPVFFWEGPDGERLLTFYSKGSYGTGILPPVEWEHPVWLAMIQTSDNHGPHDPSYIQEMKQSIAESGLDAELHIGSLTDFAEDFLARNPDLPVIRGDMADSWIHGVGTAPREVSRVRELRTKITAAESALALAKLSGDATVDAAEAKKQIDKSYEYTLHFGEHTWGMDCKTFLFPRRYEKKEFLKDKESDRYKQMEHSWQEQRDYLNTAEEALETAIQLVSDTGKPAAIRVFNDLGWKRDARVLLPKDQLLGAHETLIDCESGEPVKLHRDDNGTWADVKGLPALGYKTLGITASSKEVAAASVAVMHVVESIVDSPLRGSITDEEATIENSYLLVKISRKTGWIQSIWDKRLQKEFVDENAEVGFGQYVYDVYANSEITAFIKKYAYRFYDWGIHDFGKTGYPEQQKRVSFTTSAPELNLVQEDNSMRIECLSFGERESHDEYGNAGKISWSISLHAESPYLDIELQLKDKEETPKAESGSLVFPLKLDQAQYRINKMGTVIDPIRDLVPSSSTLLNCCEYFVDVTDGKGEVGMSIVPLDSPLFYIGKNGIWDYEHQYKPEKPELHFNLFNNMWGTNFPQWIGGDLRYRYRLIPHAGSWSEAEVWKQAEQTLRSAVAITVAESKVSTEPQVIDVLPEGLVGAAVICFKPAEDGEGCILRLREWTGTSRELVITLPASISHVFQTDLLEYTQCELSFIETGDERGDKQVILPSKPFEVHTLRIC